jgi:hypothetical protein
MKMAELFTNQASDAKLNAQRNLMGRTHFVDPDTLRFHKSRVIATHITDGGLLFALMTSDALDWDNAKRGFRYTVFDVFGTAVASVKLEDAFKTRAQAFKAMWAKLNELDAKELTFVGIANAEKHFASDMAELRKRLVEMAVTA